MTQQKRVHFICCMAEIPGYHQRLSFVNRHHPTLLTDCLTTWGLYIKGAQNKQNKSMTRGPRTTSSSDWESMEAGPPHIKFDLYSYYSYNHYVAFEDELNVSRRNCDYSYHLDLCTHLVSVTYMYITCMRNKI